MPLIKSISGFRGTIGGKPGDNLTPVDIVECTAAYGTWLLQNGTHPKVVIGRDGRISGELVSNLVVQTLLALGIDVVDLGLSTTPTVEMAVPGENAGGGIILTASHNPKEWNALKLLNEKGEFISKEAGKEILDLIEKGSFQFSSVDELGEYKRKEDWIQRHIEEILLLPLVRLSQIREKKYKVVVDCINSTGAISVPKLLEALGCEVVLQNEEITGDFAHNPEPLPENLAELSQLVVEQEADLGISVDPDVDRLAFICENGDMFGEEYTLVAVADYILKHNPGSTVSNLSSTRALRDVSMKYNQLYHASAVGEVNVVEKMKEVRAVIGGEGNGGIIYPDLHYGRDALAGIALFLSHLTETDMSVSALRSSFPDYTISKNKIQLTPSIDLDKIFDVLKEKYASYPQIVIDGLKIEFDEGWVHLRKSNTEPIIRLYSEGRTKEEANGLASRIQDDVSKFTKP